ncbi:MAG: hypothetical protein LAO19_16420 [Acidobacteriia bacterium]|nr:hypothetical protein [Terriglobia bacterium]
MNLNLRGDLEQRKISKHYNRIASQLDGKELRFQTVQSHLNCTILTHRADDIIYSQIRAHQFFPRKIHSRLGTQRLAQPEAFLDGACPGPPAGFWRHLTGEPPTSGGLFVRAQAWN